MDKRTRVFLNWILSCLWKRLEIKAPAGYGDSGCRPYELIFRIVDSDVEPYNVRETSQNHDCIALWKNPTSPLKRFSVRFNDLCGNNIADCDCELVNV